MAELALVRKKDVAFFAHFLKDKDSDIYALLRDAKVPNDLIDPKSNYHYLPATAYQNIVSVLGHKFSLQEFAEQMKVACRAYYIPQFLSVLPAGLSVRHAIDYVCGELPNCLSNSKVSLQIENGERWLVRERAYVEDTGCKYAELFSIVFMIELISMLLGQPWRPSKIGVQTHNVDEYTHIPDLSEVQFFTHRSVTAIAIPEELFVRQAASFGTKSKLSKQPQIPDNFLDLFKLVIKPYLSMGKLPIKLASEILDMHVRKIQRRLEGYGVTYSEVIEQLVLEQALDMLANTSEPITKIANQMGYSDAAHFNRAFKRMMNQTPGAYRKSVKLEGES